MTRSAGIHHITAIARDPRRNVMFYRDLLGLRLVKKTVNFDDPGTYHLYFGDEAGSPGTILTFFPWPHVAKGRPGLGQAVETAFAIPEGSVGFWAQHLIAKGIEHDPPEKRFGETVIGLRDPDGMRLELVATKGVETLPGWASGDIAAEHAIRGFRGVTLWVDDPAPTAKVLTDIFAFSAVGTEGPRHRYVAQDDAPLGTVVDLKAHPGFLPGAMGAGSIHHVAFRAADDAAEYAMRDALRGLRIGATEQMDRNYFRSIYFREPGGVLFEIATDDPGFAIDEPPDSLGTHLKLPRWLESRRAEVEAALPALD